MWIWTLNWGEIRDDLVLGSCPTTSEDLDRIHDETGASALLSLQTDDCRSSFGIDLKEMSEHARSRGLTLANTPMRDFDAADQRKRLPTAVGVLRSLLADGHRAYVHCNAGCNRAPLTVLGYLTFVEEMTVEDAMALITAGRPEAAPFWESYFGCREDVLLANRGAVENRALVLAERDPTAGSEANWFRAEHEILCETFW